MWSVPTGFVGLVVLYCSYLNSIQFNSTVELGIKIENCDYITNKTKSSVFIFAKLSKWCAEQARNPLLCFMFGSNCQSSVNWFYMLCATIVTVRRFNSNISGNCIYVWNAIIVIKSNLHIIVSLFFLSAEWSWSECALCNIYNNWKHFTIFCIQQLILQYFLPGFIWHCSPS